MDISEHTLDTLKLAIPAFAGFMLLVVGVLALKRDRDIKALAGALGLQFAKRRAYDLEDTGLGVLTSGGDRDISNHISGLNAAGAAARFFDLKFRVGAGRGGSTYRLTVALFEFPRPLFPAFTLRQEGVFDRVGEAAGWEDIDIPGAEEFSGRYRLSGEDEAAIRAFWTPSRLASFSLPSGSKAEARGKYLALYKYQVKVDGRTYPAFMEEAKSAAAALAG